MGSPPPSRYERCSRLCAAYACACDGETTPSAASKLPNERSKLRCWSLERPRPNAVVESREPDLCVGGKEKWFALPSCLPASRVHAASLEEECICGSLARPPNTMRRVSLHPLALSSLCPSRSFTLPKETLMLACHIRERAGTCGKTRILRDDRSGVHYAHRRKPTVHLGASMVGLLGSCEERRSAPRPPPASAVRANAYTGAERIVPRMVPTGRTSSCRPSTSR